MKKVLLTLLGIIVVLGVLAGAGFAGYRMGYRQGASGDTTAFVPRQGMPMHNFEKDLGPQQGMPMRNINRGFDRGFGPGGFGMMGRGMRGGGMGLFSLFHIAVLAIIIWLAYKWFKSSGWTLTRQTVQNSNKESVEPEPKNE